MLDDSHPPEPGVIEIAGERIVSVEHTGAAHNIDHGDAGCLIAPGFIDAHIHPPQIDGIGRDGLRLLEWLDEVIFPAECAWADAEFAAAQLREAQNRMLRAGTLGYAGYLTSHAHGLDVLRREHARLPLRTIAGVVLMDRNGPAELLREAGDVDDAIVPQDDRAAGNRLAFSANPRFALSCSEAMLNAAARAAAIQTHLAETQEECDKVAELFPDAAHYTDVYDRAGLLKPGALLAHCVHLSEEEWKLLAKRDCVAVHCPAANTFLQAGLFDLAAAKRAGVRLALGSDVAAGPDIAMPRVARAMIDVAKMRRMHGDREANIPTPAEAWNMITRGNADALGWGDSGRIEAGAFGDLLIIRPPFPIDEHIIERLIYEWDDSFIETRIVAGAVADIATYDIA